MRKPPENRQFLDRSQFAISARNDRRAVLCTALRKLDCMNYLANRQDPRFGKGRGGSEPELFAAHGEVARRRADTVKAILRGPRGVVVGGESGRRSQS